MADEPVTIEVPKLGTDGKILVEYLPPQVENVANALDDARTIDDALMAENVGTGGAFDTALSAANAELVPPLVMDAMNADPVIRQTLLDGVSGAVADLNIGREIGVETTEFYKLPDGAVAAFALRDGTRAATFYANGEIVLEAQESSGLSAGAGVVAAFAHRGDHSIVTKILADGRMVPGDYVPAAYLGVAFGDSITQGADLADPLGQRWTSKLSVAVGEPIANRGRSGARADEIAWYAGAVTATGTPTGGSIPASGSVVITGLDVDPWRADASWTTPVIALTDDGTTVRGTISLSGTDRVFTRESAGAAVTTSRVQFRAVDVPKGRILFLGMGVNDEPLVAGGTRTGDEIVSWYHDVLSRHDGPAVVWAMLDRGLAEKEGTVIGDLIRYVEGELSMLGDVWYPVRRYLASQQALTDATLVQPTFTPTADDIAASAEDTVPPSFRSSPTSVHPNALGHDLIARYIHRQLILRGHV